MTGNVDNEATIKAVDSAWKAVREAKGAVMNRSTIAAMTPSIGSGLYLEAPADPVEPGRRGSLFQVHGWCA